MSGFQQDSNPYAPSSVYQPFNQPEKTDGKNSRAEEIRNHHLSHEASIKSFGILYLLGGTIGTLLGIGYIVGGITMLVNPPQQGGGLPFVFLCVLGVIVLAISVFQFATGLGLRKVKSWSKIAGIILACVGLLGFPIGTLISGYFLYLLLSEKGQFIFSDEYRQIMAQTPHIKYKTSIIVWIFLGLLVALILFGVIGALVAG